MVCVFVCVQVRRGPLQTLIRVFNPSLPSSPQPPEQRVGGNGYWFFLFIILSLDDFSLAVDNIFSLSLFISFFYLLTYLEADQMLLSELSRVFILRECAWVRTQARITEREAEYLKWNEYQIHYYPIRLMLLSKVCYNMPHSQWHCTLGKSKAPHRCQ